MSAASRLSAHTFVSVRVCMSQDAQALLSQCLSPIAHCSPFELLSIYPSVYSSIWTSPISCLEGSLSMYLYYVVSLLHPANLRPYVSSSSPNGLLSYLTPAVDLFPCVPALCLQQGL